MTDSSGDHVVPDAGGGGLLEAIPEDGETLSSTPPPLEQTKENASDVLLLQDDVTGVTRQMSEDTVASGDSGQAADGSQTDLDAWQADIAGNLATASEFTAHDAYASTAPSLAQAPKLEVIEEHEILETTVPAASLASPTVPEVLDNTTLTLSTTNAPGQLLTTDDSTAALLTGGDRPKFYLGATTSVPLDSSGGLLGVEQQQQVGVFEAAEYYAETPSRHGSFGAYSHFSRQDSHTTAHGGAAAPELTEPLLIRGLGGPDRVDVHRLSEPMLRKSQSEVHGFGGFLRQMGTNLTRRIFGSTTGMSRAESIASLELGQSGTIDGSARQRHHQRARYVDSSRNSVSSEVSALQISLKGPMFRGVSHIKNQFKSRPPRIMAPTGAIVPRSRRFLTKGTAGFLHAKGTSAISLRPAEPSQGFPSPCGECPYCRKFLKLGQPGPIPAPGRSCNCRICLIIEEGNPNGPPSLLQFQNATRKTSGRGGVGRQQSKTSKTSISGHPKHHHHHHVTQSTTGGGVLRVPSEYGIFCSQCSQMNLAASAAIATSQTTTAGGEPNQAGATRTASNRLSAAAQTVGVPISQQYPVPVLADVHIDTVAGCVSPSDVQSVETSTESLFIGIYHRHNRDQMSAQHSIAPPSIVGVSNLCASQQSVACPSMVGGTSTVSAPFCRICHQFYEKDGETLMSPCRCLGSLRYVHESCLVHWLEILHRKFKRPAICELCGYKYKRRRYFKYHQMVWPRCSTRDKVLHLLTVMSVLTMFLCAATTLVCFQLEGDIRVKTDDKNKQLSATEVVTLIAGLLFFVTFFVAMYAEVKAKHTVFKLICRWWTLSHDWKVDEYNAAKDQKFWAQKQDTRKQQQQQQQQQQKQQQQQQQQNKQQQQQQQEPKAPTPSPVPTNRNALSASQEVQPKVSVDSADVAGGMPTQSDTKHTELDRVSSGVSLDSTVQRTAAVV